MNLSEFKNKIKEKEENLKVYRTIIVTLLCTLHLQLLINFNQHALVLD